MITARTAICGLAFAAGSLGITAASARMTIQPYPYPIQKPKPKPGCNPDYNYFAPCKPAKPHKPGHHGDKHDLGKPNLIGWTKPAWPLKPKPVYEMPRPPVIEPPLRHPVRSLRWSLLRMRNSADSTAGGLLVHPPRLTGIPGRRGPAIVTPEPFRPILQFAPLRARKRRSNESASPMSSRAYSIPVILICAHQ